MAQWLLSKVGLLLIKFVFFSFSYMDNFYLFHCNCTRV